LICNRIKEPITCQQLRRLQSLFQRKGYIMQWIMEMWYYEQEEDNFKKSAKTILHMLLFTTFCCFQRRRMGGIQKFQSVVLNLENKEKMQGKEMGRNVLAHRWCLIDATMPIVFMSEMVLSYLSFIVESCFSSL